MSLVLIGSWPSQPFPVHRGAVSKVLLHNIVAWPLAGMVTGSYRSGLRLVPLGGCKTLRAKTPSESLGSRTEGFAAGGYDASCKA